MSLDPLRERVIELAAMQTRLEACIVDVRAAGEVAIAQLAQAAKQELATRPLGAVPPTNSGFAHGHISLEAVRDAVVTLKHFTIGELAAELGCSTARARKELDRVKHLVGPDGHLGQRQLWAYIPPQGPGAAFTQQQKLRPLAEDLTIARSQSANIAQSNLSMISDKEIKKVVREALAEGWELVHGTGKHPMRLVKPGCSPVGLASSPTNSGHAARAIRRQLRAA